MIRLTASQFQAFKGKTRALYSLPHVCIKDAPDFMTGLLATSGSWLSRLDGHVLREESRLIE